MDILYIIIGKSDYFVNTFRRSIKKYFSAFNRSPVYLSEIKSNANINKASDDSAALSISLNQNSITMIHLMLNDLRRPACEVFCSRLHIQGLILHLDSLVALALAESAEKRQTAFLGVVRSVFFDDLRIEHHRVCRNSSAFIEKGDDALAHTT